MANMTSVEFKAMLARVIAKSKASPATATAIKEAAEVVMKEMDAKEVVEVDLKELGIKDEQLTTSEGKEAAEEVIAEVISNTHTVSADRSTETSVGKTEKDLGVAREISLNKKQQEGHDLVLTGKSCVIVGAAGTGKTTSVRKISRSLMQAGYLPPITEGTKWVGINSPGCVVLSFTRKAVNNIRRAVIDELKPNTLTIHKIIEFEPQFFTIDDPERPGFTKSTMRFVPTRDRTNPLPSSIKTVIFEESSMIDCTLYNQFCASMPHQHQQIFLGDIQQLPPVFGAAVLGYKMLELPVVELTEVYRQARDSPILDTAWKLLEGNPHVFSARTVTTKVFNEHVKKEVSRISVPALDLLSKKTEAGELKFQVWQKQLSADLGLATCVKQFNMWEHQGYYNPNDDIILCPFNKAFGTIELNKGIQQHLGRKRGAEVYEIIAGFDKHYLAVGDRVLYDKEDAFITSITKNGQYLGKSPQPPNKLLDRWGHVQEDTSKEEEHHVQEDEKDLSEDDLDRVLQLAAESSEDRVQAASHIINIRFAFSDEEAVLETAGEINNLLGGNAVTIHKFQGSECRRVFLVLHNSHATMISRELLYTGVTRAREFIHIICEPTTFEKGIKSQRIKGNTLAEKAEFFKGKQDGTIPVKSGNLVRLLAPVSELLTVPNIPANEASTKATEVQHGDTTGIHGQTAAERLAALKMKLGRR